MHSLDTQLLVVQAPQSGYQTPLLRLEAGLAKDARREVYQIAIWKSSKHCLSLAL